MRFISTKIARKVIVSNHPWYYLNPEKTCMVEILLGFFFSFPKSTFLNVFSLQLWNLWYMLSWIKKNLRVVLKRVFHSTVQMNLAKVALLARQTTCEGSQQYLWPQSRADSLSMSESLMEKSKISAFPLILSGFDDLGSTAAPCCTAQRSSTWKEEMGKD